jgi:magnesium-transporting ATPase (P-type)
MNIISSVIGINLRSDNLPNYDKNERKAEYLFYYNKTNPGHALEITRIISNNFLIYNTLIPISIFIAFTFCKIMQTIYLQQFSPEYRKDPSDNIKCYNTGLIDELGLVKYIFSDKTGTLTKNEMIFKGCSINRELFDEDVNNNLSMASDTYIAQNMFNVPPQSGLSSIPSYRNLSSKESTKGWTNQSKITTSKVSPGFPQANLFKQLQKK